MIWEDCMKKKMASLVKEMEDVMWANREYGAADTEPDTEFHIVIMKAITHGKVVVPTNGDGWQLFTLSMDCEQAAKELTATATKVADWFVENRQAIVVQNWAQAYCWRVPF